MNINTHVNFNITLKKRLKSFKKRVPFKYVAFNNYEQEVVETARRQTALAMILVPATHWLMSSDKSPYLSGPQVLYQ